MQLAAEVLFVQQLTPFKVKGETKAKLIQNVLSLGSAPIEIPQPMREALDYGLVTDVSFNIHRPYHLSYIIELARAWKAIGSRKDEPTALSLIREVEERVSKSAKYFRIMVEGQWAWEADEDSGPLGFYTTYDVVAENADEAFRFVSRFEPSEVRASLRLESTEEIEARPDDPKGVYKVTGYHLFPLEDDD